MTRLTLAVPTYRRNSHLTELLPMLLAEMSQLSIPSDLVVIDNDPRAGAREAVASIVDDRVRYVHEPSPGLAAVRNRAIDEASNSQLLAFIDDDGRPSPGWLSHMVETWHRERPASVAGRVLETYESTPPKWIREGGFFRRPSLPTGTTVAAAGAGNLMLDMDDLRRSGITFDRRFGFSGGEDTLLTRQLTSAGYRIVWCDEARIVDQVSSDRLNRRWLLKRAWSHGNGSVMVDRALAVNMVSGLTARAKGLGGGSIRVMVGVIRFIAGVLLVRPRERDSGLHLVFRGGGMVAGALGHETQEYSR